MPDYKFSNIYTIKCKFDENLVYVGSTTKQLSKRFAKHKSGEPTSIGNYGGIFLIEIGVIGILNYLLIIRVIIKNS